MSRSVFITVALLAVRSNSASLFDQPKVKGVQVGAVEINITVDKSYVQNGMGEILIEAYPFKFGVVRDSKQRLNAHVYLDEMFNLSSQAMTVKWDSLLGQSGVQTSLVYSSQTLPGSPFVNVTGQWSVEDVKQRSGQLKVNLTDSQRVFKIATSVTVDAAQQTTAGVSLALGPLTLTLEKDAANKIEDSVDLILPTVQAGDYMVESTVGFSQNGTRQTEFYVATSSGLFKGQINVDSSVNVDVIGGVTLYDYENDGIQIQVEHYHTDQNAIFVKFSLGPLTGTTSIDKANNHTASFVLDFQFAKFNMDIGKDGIPVYQATAELDPLSFSAKANENGLNELSVKVFGRNEYSLLLKTDLGNNYNLDLVIYGQPFSIHS